MKDKEKEQPCLLCLGTGKVKVPDGYSECPMCHGKGSANEEDKRIFTNWMMGRKGMWK